MLGTILTRFNGRTLLAQEVKEMAENMAAQIGTRLFARQIRPSVVVAEAPAHGLSVYDHSPWSNPSLDYQAFVKEVFMLTSDTMKA